MLTSIELCAGAGGQALGLEQAGFVHEALIEIDPHCCITLRQNRPCWNVLEQDVRLFKRDCAQFKGVDVVAGGLPCPPFSVAGKQLGENDERNLFDDALDIIETVNPAAVMIENVRGFLDPVFAEYRETLKSRFEAMGYAADWQLLNASDYGVPQLRPRVVIVALKKEHRDRFLWPRPRPFEQATVGRVLYDLMAANGWRGVDQWSVIADEVAPTIVGGSKKHGGPDLGPTRARQAWAALGIEGRTIAEEAPDMFFSGSPRLTIPMVAKLQGFPDEWKFSGKKTHAYRQVGNAFPPPVAYAVASSVRNALTQDITLAAAS